MNQLFKIGFFSVTLIDFLDILIVAGIIFWLYRALKDTIAIQVLVGLVILIGLQFFAEAISLRSLNWILKTISTIWLLAFIILFQPEIRKILLLFTQNPIFSIFIKSKISEMLEEVTDAAIELSEKHIGALIVFARTQNVTMNTEIGIKIQATVSTELLISIFNPKSPLHDGAVVLDNNMLMNARCVLPLSTVTKFNGKNLGTRHRAALGLVEQIDALVLIVSEETGWISIAEKANLELNIPKENLLVTLRNRLTANH
ncbi:MAG: diadenylate cyclase CdaA [Candidatus Kapabacteria bacterium]|nr:diadenylate cyclase CdaA [Candidatus Kapabacteria bacterium]